MTFAEKITLLKNDHSLNLRMFRDITGLSKTTMNKIMNDSENPTLKTIDKIARGFNMSISDLLKDVG